MSTGSLFVNFEARCWAEQARDLLYLAVAVRAGLGVASGRCEEAPDEREKKEAKQKKKKRNDDVNHRSSLPSFGQRARSLFSPSCTHPSPCMAAEKRKGARSPSRKGGSRSLSLRACKEKTEAFDRKKESESESERRRKKKKQVNFFFFSLSPFLLLTTTREQRERAGSSKERDNFVRLPCPNTPAHALWPSPLASLAAPEPCRDSPSRHGGPATGAGTARAWQKRARGIVFLSSVAIF